MKNPQGLMHLDSQEQAIPKYCHDLLYDYGVGFVTVISGGTGRKIGAGKSYTALRIAELVDKNFTVDNVCFTVTELLDTFKRIEEEGKPGKVVILDEGAITLSNRAYFSKINETINHIVTTFRSLRCMFIVVTPCFDWIDSRVRSLCTLWIKTQLIKQGGKKEVLAKVSELRTDKMGKDLFEKKLAFYYVPEDVEIEGEGYMIQLPTKPLIDAYEAKAKAYKSNLRENLYSMAKMLEERMQRVDLAEVEGTLFTEVIEHPKIKERIELGKPVTANLISTLFYPRVNERQAQRYAKQLKINKGDDDI